MVVSKQLKWIYVKRVIVNEENHEKPHLELQVHRRGIEHGTS